MIVADDVGYFDIGAFDSEISTPNIHALAAAWQNYADANGVIEPDEAVFYSKPIVGRKY